MPRLRCALSLAVAALIASCSDEESLPPDVAADVQSDAAVDASAADADNDSSMETGEDAEDDSSMDADDDSSMDAGDDAADDASSGDASATWGSPCTDDDACSAPADYCVLQPGETTGYCGARCERTEVCGTLGAPEGWTCNTVEFLGCDDAATNWCAPPEELIENAAFLIECTE